MSDKPKTQEELERDYELTVIYQGDMSYPMWVKKKGTESLALVTQDRNPVTTAMICLNNEHRGRVTLCSHMQGASRNNCPWAALESCTNEECNG